MKITAAVTARVLGALVVAVPVVGCKNPLSSSVQVEYRVTGSATRASMTYATSAGGTAQTSDSLLPWTYTWTATKGDFVYVSAQNRGSSGCVTAEIKQDGKVTQSTQSCGAFVIATSSGTAE